MKLQSHISRKYKSNSYRKFWIIIPRKIIEKIDWKIGQNLKAKIKKDKLVIEKDGND